MCGMGLGYGVVVGFVGSTFSPPTLTHPISYLTHLTTPLPPSTQPPTFQPHSTTSTPSPNPTPSTSTHSRLPLLPYVYVSLPYINPPRLSLSYPTHPPQPQPLLQPTCPPDPIPQAPLLDATISPL